MANYAADSVYSEHPTPQLAADGLETLLEATATTLIIRFASVIRLHEHSYIAILTTSNATV